MFKEIWYPKVKGKEHFFLVRLELKILSHKLMKCMFTSSWLLFHKGCCFELLPAFWPKIQNLPTLRDPSLIAITFTIPSWDTKGYKCQVSWTHYLPHFLPWQNQLPLLSSCLMCGTESHVSPIKCTGRHFYLEVIYAFLQKFKHSNNHALKISFLSQWSQLLGRPRSGGLSFKRADAKS
jgi:hypothetical protein